MFYKFNNSFDYDDYEMKKDLLSLLHDFSREVVGELEVDTPEKIWGKRKVGRPSRVRLSAEKAVLDGKTRLVNTPIRNQLRSEQLERADKLIGGE